MKLWLSLPQAVHLSLLCVVALHIVGCCMVPRTPPRTSLESPETFLVQGRPALGAVILVHGLNQRPSSLNPLARELQSMGFSAYRLTLRGHERESQGSFSESLWEDDVASAYTSVRERHPSAPIYLLGYSLGGLLVTRALDTHPELHPSGVVLMAPALSLRLLPQTGYLLTLLPPLSWTVPNIAPALYRRFANTPLFWYRNTFALYQATRELKNPGRLGAIPTTIIANPRDELVSLSGLRGWLDDNQLLDRWRIEIVRPSTPNPAIPGHVIIDERSLGSREWTRMLGIIHDSIETPVRRL
jgi:esterase/lipase